MTKTIVAEVDLRGVYACRRLFARRIWQLLFNEYRKLSAEIDSLNDRLNNMDDMLCDYPLLCDELERYWIYTRFWWRCSPYHGGTDLTFSKYSDVEFDYNYHGYFVVDSDKGITKFVLEKNED